MNGTIGFEAAEGGGTLFFVEFPLLPSVWADGEPPKREDRVLVSKEDIDVALGLRRTIFARPARVLHVESDGDLRRVVRQLLPEAWQVESAGTVADARARLANASFDLVLLELALSDGSGEALLGAVGGAPVILFSAADASPALASRVSLVLVKSRTSEVQLLDAVLAMMLPSAGLQPEGVT